MNKYKSCSGPGRGPGVVFAVQLRTVGFESIFPLKEKKYTKWQQWRPAFKSTSKHQCLVLKLVVLKTLYFIFKQHTPCQDVTFFPLFKQAARVMAWWTNFISFCSVFSIFNTASSRPDGTNAIASKSIHLAAFLKWQIWWIEPQLLYKASFQNALPGTCLL